MSGERESLFSALRADAEKWRERAAADGGGIDPKAEEILALLAERDGFSKWIVQLQEQLESERQTNRDLEDQVEELRKQRCTC